MKLIQIKDYLLLIDKEAEINISESTMDYDICPCWGVNKYGEGIVWYFDDKRMNIGNFIETTQTGSSGYDIIKINGYSLFPIIAYYPLTKEAKELDLPLLPNPFEEKEIDAEKLACNIYNLSLDEYEYINEDLSQNRSLIEEHYKDINREEIAERYFDVISFIAGYNAAQSDKQFSLEDVRKAIEMAKKGYIDFDQEDNAVYDFVSTEEEIVQSLSTQQLPKEFIPEYRYYYHSSKEFYSDAGFVECSKEQYESIKAEIPTCPLKTELKTITNSEGKEVVQGKWIY